MIGIILRIVLFCFLHQNATAQIFIGNISGTHGPSKAQKLKSVEIGTKWDRANRRKKVIAVDVYWHIIGNLDGDGILSEEKIAESMLVLNEAFSPHFSFRLLLTDVTLNRDYFSSNPSSNSERKMKEGLRRGEAMALNIYSLNSVGEYNDGLLGWSTFPFEYSEDPILDGVVIDYTTIPGGTAQGVYGKYDLGITLVHEVGHWFGLFTTFEGSCSSDNDLVEDTPAHNGPNYSCSGEDTCPNFPGNDPINNYMNYSPDSCKDEFTNGQFFRMYAEWAEYRDTSATAPPNLAPTPRPTQPPRSCDAEKEDELVVQIETDDHGAETSWDLKADCTGEILFFENEMFSDSFYETRACIPKPQNKTLYKFTIYDRWGDGICCQTGKGRYTVKIGTESYSGGSFSLSESFFFGSTCPPTIAPLPSEAPSLVPTIEPSSSVPRCFSPVTEADVLGKGRVMMRDLVVGDKVLTASGEHKTVFTINHYSATKVTSFLRIHTEGLDKEQMPLELTSNHMLFAGDNEYPVPAVTIKIGDTVRTTEGLKKVVKIDRINRKGLYNPLTMDGTIIANGVVASVYTSQTGSSHIEIAGSKVLPFHDAMDVASISYRSFCTIISLRFCDTHEEISRPSLFMIMVFKYWSNQNSYIQYFVFFLYLLLFRTLAVVVSFKFLLMTNFLTFVAGVKTYMSFGFKIKKKIKHQ